MELRYLSCFQTQFCLSCQFVMRVLMKFGAISSGCDLNQRKRVKTGQSLDFGFARGFFVLAGRMGMPRKRKTCHPNGAKLIAPEWPHLNPNLQILFYHAILKFLRTLE